MLHYKTFEHRSESEWVVFVHGAGGSSAVWFKQLRMFREAFNILLVDLRGHGRSKDFHGRDSSYSIPSISLDIVDVMDHLKIESAHFVGVSLGTILVRCLGEIAPVRVRSMIMAGAITGFNIWARILIASGHFLKYILPFRTLYRAFAWIIMPGSKAREAREIFRREARRVTPAEFRKWLRMTREVNERLRSWSGVTPSSPILYVMGGNDYIFLPLAREVVNRCRNSFLSVIEGAGHVCNVERPDEFNRRALEFLRSPVLATAPAV